MGYITTLSIYNDDLDSILEDSKEFCEKVVQASHNSLIDGKQVFGHGYSANLVTVQRTRHADDPTIYIHYGNHVQEINPWGEEYLENLKENNPESFNSIKGLLLQALHTMQDVEKGVKVS